MHGSDFLGACQRLIELADDAYYLISSCGREVAVCPKVLSDYVPW